MTRVRLRSAYTPEHLALVYSAPYDHTHHPDHLLRVAVTAELAKWVVMKHGVTSVADLACGDGAVLDSLADLIPRANRHYADLVPNFEASGPIEQTVRYVPPVGLMILTETLEHLDDPDLVLNLARMKAGRLVLSTPVGTLRAQVDENVEHYWSWIRDDVEAMLTAAGWAVEVYQEIDFRPAGSLYSFGLWAAS